MIFDVDGQADIDCIEKSEKISAEECERFALAMDAIKRLWAKGSEIFEIQGNSK